jgi:hypothetical protein
LCGVTSIAGDVAASALPPRSATTGKLAAHIDERTSVWVVGVGVFAALAVFVVWVGVSKMRKASRGE